LPPRSRGGGPTGPKGEVSTRKGEGKNSKERKGGKTGCFGGGCPVGKKRSRKGKREKTFPLANVNSYWAVGGENENT